MTLRRTAIVQAAPGRRRPFILQCDTWQADFATAEQAHARKRYVEEARHCRLEHTVYDARTGEEVPG